VSVSKGGEKALIEWKNEVHYTGSRLIDDISRNVSIEEHVGGGGAIHRSETKNPPLVGKGKGGGQ